MRWLEGAASAAGLAAVAGGIATAVSGGQLEIALYVVGLVAFGTVAMYGLLSLSLDFREWWRRGRKPPLIRSGAENTDREVFWFTYLGFLASVAALLAWASIDEPSLRKSATDMNALHVFGIAVLGTAAIGLGLVIQPGRGSQTKPCPECASQIPVTARTCFRCGHRLAGRRGGAAKRAD